MPVPSRSAVRARMSRKLALAFLAAAVSASLGGEAYFRFIRPVEYRRPTTHRDGTLWKNLVHCRSEIVGLDYEMKPLVHRTVNGALVETNSLGMRDAEPRKSSGDLDTRIVAVGDSLTFGTRVSGAEAWPNALESRLNGLRTESDRSFEVLNLGVSGYGAHDEALVVLHKAMPLSPRLVIVGYYLNDPETEPVQQLHQYFRDPKAWEHSALLRRIAFGKRVRDQERLGGGDVFRYLHRAPDKWRSVVHGLEDIAESTSAAGTNVLFVVLPTLRGFERWEDYPYADLHAQAIEAARAAGLDALDLLPTWRESGRTPDELRADEEHPNALGHALIAQAVLGKLRATPRLLEGPRFAAATAPRSTPRAP